MDQQHLADLAGANPRDQIRDPQPADRLKREAGDARRLDRLDHAIGLGDRHRHRLAEDHVLAGPRRGDRHLGHLRDRRGDVHDVHVLPFEQLAVIAGSRER